MLPLSVPSEGSITQSMSAGLPDARASRIAAATSSGVVACYPLPPKALIMYSCRARSAVGAGSSEPETSSPR